jgi:hypothetical protein
VSGSIFKDAAKTYKSRTDAESKNLLTTDFPLGKRNEIFVARGLDAKLEHDFVKQVQVSAASVE